MSSHGNAKTKDIPQCLLAQPGKNTCLVSLRAFNSSSNYNKKAAIPTFQAIFHWWPMESKILPNCSCNMWQHFISRPMMTAQTTQFNIKKGRVLWKQLDNNMSCNLEVPWSNSYRETFGKKTPSMINCSWEQDKIIKK